mgnify:CR=1 FL=1|jgi:hypothetical protein
MGLQQSTPRINYEDIINILKNKNNYLLMNTISSDLQDCLIPGTININKEEQLINELMRENRDINIIIYGKNANDISVYNKHEQLVKLGFTNVFIYPGGMFEWICLQDIYGEENFPTTKKELDILKFKAKSILNKLYLQN